MARTQIRVHRWRPKTRISALLRRWTNGDDDDDNDDSNKVEEHSP